MSSVPVENSAEDVAPAEPERAVEAAPPVKAPSQGGQERRDFFGEAVREMLMPFTGLRERKINPVLAALEQIPVEAERLAGSNFGLLDQPDPARTLPLPVRRGTARYLRPPGAMAPGEFETVCSRCAKCVEACPASAIMLDKDGLLADGAPYIVADTQPCVVCDSLACMKSCPTGALKLVERLEINMGTAAVEHEQCLRHRGEACTLCLDVCPIADGDAASGEGGGTASLRAALFVSAESGQMRVRKNVCIGCGLCESRCPTDPRAITVIPYLPPVDPIVA